MVRKMSPAAGVEVEDRDSHRVARWTARANGKRVNPSTKVARGWPPQRAAAAPSLNAVMAREQGNPVFCCSVSGIKKAGRSDESRGRQIRGNAVKTDRETLDALACPSWGVCGQPVSSTRGRNGLRRMASPRQGSLFRALCATHDGWR